MKKLWMIAGSALVMSACSDNVAEMNPAPAGNNDFVTLAEISASLPATRAYLEDVEFGAVKRLKRFGLRAIVLPSGASRSRRGCCCTV